MTAQANVPTWKYSDTDWSDRHTMTGGPTEKKFGRMVSITPEPFAGH
jgi:hypothetical protein